MTSPRIEFIVPGYDVQDVRRADGSGGWLVEARDQERDRPVLLKIIERRAAADADGIRVEERLRREARAAARVHHPSVVRVFDLGETETLLYLVMERIDAPDADAVVRRDGPMPTALACRVGRDVARGLEELHRCGVVHRDITPGNVLVPADPASEAVIVDLGLARLRDAGHGLTAEDVLLGTPGYMAPEQAENPREADARADLYGLGALLFFLLTGRPPFVGDGLEAVRLALRGGAPDVRTLRPGVSPPLARLLARLLAREPGERPGGAAEVAGALDALLNDLAETQAVTTGDIPQVAWPPAGPAAARPVHRTIAAAGFAAGLVAALGMGLSLLTGPDAGRKSAPAEPTPPATRRTPPTTAAAPPAPVAPPAPAPRDPPPTPNELANAVFETADRLMAVPPIGARDWPRFVIAHHLLAAIPRQFPLTFAARNRVPLRFRSLEQAAAGHRARATERLSGDVEHALRFGDYAFAAEAVASANPVLVDAETRARLGGEVRDAAQESFARSYREATRLADSGHHERAAQLLARIRPTSHPSHLAVIDRLVAVLRAPDAAPDLPDKSVEQRPAEPLEALADRALARRTPVQAVALLRAAMNDPAYEASRDAVAGRLREAEAMAGFFQRLIGALQQQVGTRLPMPGGRRGELLEARPADGFVVWRRAGGKSGRPLAELPATFLGELASVAVRPLAPADELALGALHLFEGDDATAVAHLGRGGPAAQRLHALARRRIDAARDERARAALDRARAAWVRGAVATAHRRLESLRHGGLLRAEGAVRESFDDLADAVNRRLSGLDGLMAASIDAGPAASDLQLTWATPDARQADRDPAVPGGDLLQLRPRWRSPLRAVWRRAAASGAGGRPATEVDRVYRIALRTAAGSEALIVLHPTGTLSLHLDGREADSIGGAALPLELGLRRRHGRQELRIRAGDAQLGGVPWAADRGLILAAGRTPGVFTVTGAVDPEWSHEARAEADRPGAPVAVRLLGPPKQAVVRWEPPLHGVAAGYRVWVATSTGDSLLAPLGVFQHAGMTAKREERLHRFAAGAVLGVYIEPIGRDGRPGPASAPLFVADLRNAGAVAVGGDGRRYVTLPGAVPVVRLRADGRPEAVQGTPTIAARNAPASRGLAVAVGRGGWRIALSDPAGPHAWTWIPGETAVPLGAGTLRGGGGVSVDAIGNWWIAAPAQNRLYSFYGRDRGLIAPVAGPDGAQGFAKQSPSHVAVLHDGRLAASDPRNDRVVIYEPRLGWFKVQSVVPDLPGAGALAAGARGTLWVALRDGFAAVTPPAGPNVHMAPPIHTREVDGVPLKRVTGLSVAPDGALWVLDGGAGRLLRYRP